MNIVGIRHSVGRLLVGGMSHVQAADAFEKAFRNEFGRNPSLSERQAVQALSCHESSYGAGFPDGANNMGAITSVPFRPPCADNAFEFQDSSPGEEPEIRCFKAYPSAADGARDVIRQVYRSTRNNRGPKALAAAHRGDLRGFSAALYDGGYFEGFTKNRDKEIDRYTSALQKCIDRMIKATGEKDSFISGGENSGFNGASLMIGIAAVAGAIFFMTIGAK